MAIDRTVKQHVLSRNSAEYMENGCPLHFVLAQLFPRYTGSRDKFLPASIIVDHVLNVYSLPIWELTQLKYKLYTIIIDNSINTYIRKQNILIN